MSAPFGENDLVDPAALVGFAGAPFTQAEVDAAVTAVRAEAGWHIAPKRADLKVPLTAGHRLLRLPTCKLVSVQKVQDVVADTEITSTMYRIILSRNGLLKNSGYWPFGLDRLEISFTHGFDECPPDLLPVIAEAAVMVRATRTSANAATLAAGPFQMSFGSLGSLPVTSNDTLDRYRLVELGAA